MAVYKRHVLGCNATTNAPFSTPSPFLCTHRPNRVSCPMPATSNTVLTCCARPVFPDASASGCRAHSALSANSGGGVQKWSEFTTPVAATVPTSANDLNFASSFQSRIEGARGGDVVETAAKADFQLPKSSQPVPQSGSVQSFVHRERQPLHDR